MLSHYILEGKTRNPEVGRDSGCLSYKDREEGFFPFCFQEKKKKTTCMAEAPDTAAFQGLPFVSTPLPSVRCSLLCGDLQQCMQRFACVEKCMCVASQSWLAKQAVFLPAAWCQTEHLHFTAGNSDTQKREAKSPRNQCRHCASHCKQNTATLPASLVPVKCLVIPLGCRVNENSGSSRLFQ